MQAIAKVFPPKRGRAASWTAERLAQLGKHDIENLRDNALRLGEPELAALCAEALKSAPKGAGRGNGPLKGARAANFIPRGRAFQARGVFLTDPSCWSGVARDGAVVIALWADAVEARDGGCSGLLWAPNEDGSRPWSDGPAGRERLEHCRLALAHGGATLLLVHGEALAGRLPEDKARSIHGIDPQIALDVRVRRDGEAYWAVWGRTSGTAAAAS